MVKPDNDTCYSTAWLDLAPEAQVLTFPDTKGRYYLLSMLNIYMQHEKPSGDKEANWLPTP